MMAILMIFLYTICIICSQSTVLQNDNWNEILKFMDIRNVQNLRSLNTKFRALMDNKVSFYWKRLQDLIDKLSITNSTEHLTIFQEINKLLNSERQTLLLLKLRSDSHYFFKVLLSRFHDNRQRNPMMSVYFGFDRDLSKSGSIRENFFTLFLKIETKIPGSLEEVKNIGWLFGLKLMDDTINNGDALGDIAMNDIKSMIKFDPKTVCQDVLLKFDEGVIEVLCDLKYYIHFGIPEQHVIWAWNYMIATYWQMNIFQIVTSVIRRQHSLPWVLMLWNCVATMDVKYPEYFGQGCMNNLVVVIRMCFSLARNLGMNTKGAIYWDFADKLEGYKILNQDDYVLYILSGILGTNFDRWPILT